jgi:hypothetical protein
VVKRLARAVSRSNSSIRGHCAPGSGVRGALLVVGLSSDAKAESQPKWSSASSWTMLTSAHLHWFRRLRIRWEIRDDIHEAFLHRPLPADSDQAQAIAVLARAQQDAVWNRQQIGNQIRSLLREYYPAALDAFLAKQGGLAREEARIILAEAPTPTEGSRLSLSQLRSALKRAGRVRSIDEEADRLHSVLRAEYAHQLAAVENDDAP